VFCLEVRQGESRTLPKHFLGNIVELKLELVKELVDCGGQLALCIGVLGWTVKSDVDWLVHRVGEGARTGFDRRDSPSGGVSYLSEGDLASLDSSAIVLIQTV
jgi:hypothetical protein